MTRPERNHNRVAVSQWKRWQRLAFKGHWHAEETLPVPLVSLVPGVTAWR